MDLSSLRSLFALICVALTLSAVSEAGLLVGRVDVTPSGGGIEEKPQARVVGEDKSGRIYAGSTNRGDWEIAADISAENPAGKTLALSDGVLIPSLNELVPTSQRGVIGVGGKLTTGTGSKINGGPWVAGFTAAGDGAEANYDFAFAYFPFADGWMGGHVAKDGATFLGRSGFPDETRIKRIVSGARHGEILLRIPHIDTREDGLLFTTAAGNGDDTTAAGPLPDGSGWHIRVADESHNFKSEQAVPFSFVFVPYDCEGLTAGRVLRDGKVARGVGTFAALKTDKGRYELWIPGKTDKEGILLLAITQTGKDGVEDNALAWSYETTACRGQGGFVVEAYDQPGFDCQDCEFSFAFLEYRTEVAPGNRRETRFRVGPDWEEAVLRGASPDDPRPSPGQPVPWFGPVMRKGMSAVRGEMSVAGLKRVWLIADDVDGNGSDHSVWVDAAFVLADGSRRSLTDADRVFHRVGYGELTTRNVTIAGQDFADAIFAHAHSTLAYTVPPGAVRFEARVGIADPGADNSSVRFAILDEPHRRDAWQDDIWPAVRRAFPAEAARLVEDIGENGLAPKLHMATHRGDIRKGLAAMETELGDFVAEEDGAEPIADDRILLRRYGAAARMLWNVSAARTTLWTLAPELAGLVDYPLATYSGLDTSLGRIKTTRPDLASEAEKRQRLLTNCRRETVQALRTILAGGTPSPTRLTDLTKAVASTAEWGDRALGWTTHGGNTHRNWVCHEQVTLPLTPGWIYHPVAPPMPAWPPPRKDNPAVNHQLSPTLTYDRAFHPVAADGKLYFGSSSEDALICLDAGTGTEQWRFVAGGPIRLAPTLYGSRVFAGSDDGGLYCLDAVTGRHVWTYRADRGEDRRLCGNGRIISEWPVRAGICVDDGVVYAAAGIFPSLGTALFALGVEDGRERWRRDIECVPQGFMLLSPDRIFLPTGRTPLQAFDRATGKPIITFGRSNSWGSDLPGGTQAVVVNKQILTGPDEGGEFRLYDASSAECVVREKGRQMIVDGLATYVLQEDKLIAQERDPFVRRGNVSVKWETAVDDAYCMLKVGKHLLTGGDRRVLIYDADNGNPLTDIPVAGGRVEGLVWHDRRLFVSVADGSIASFSSRRDAPPSPAISRPLSRDIPASEQRRAADIARWAGAAKGYALVAGAPDLATALARTSELKIILLMTTEAEVTEWRTRLSTDGLCGHRISVHQHPPRALPYRPFLFDLVVLLKTETRCAPREWLRVLRPEGGLLIIRDQEILAEAASAIPGTWEEAPAGLGQMAGFRRGSLPGAGRWDHGYGDPGNTACSGDAMPFSPLTVLWFGRPGPRHMLQRHIKGAAPLCAQGTLYITGKDYLAAADAYNGTVLWEKHIGGSGRVGMLKDCGNMVAADGNLYVAADGACHVIEGRTGRPVATFGVHGSPLPDAHWGYVATSNGVLVGSSTNPRAELKPDSKEDHDIIWYHHKPVVTSASVFGMDRTTGRPLWSYTPSAGVIVNPTLTILDGLLLFVESTATGTDEDGRAPLADLVKEGPRLTALELVNGRPAWSVPVDLSGFEHAIYMSGSQGILVLTGTRHQQFEKKKLIQYRLVGIDAETGRELWRNDNTPTYAHVLNGGHGEQTQHPAIVRDKILGPGFTRDLRSGAAIEGWHWQKSNKCATLSTSLNCAFSRQNGNPTVADLGSGKTTTLTKVTRPGCWINTLPVGGIVLIPEASSGCTCGYSIQTTLALYPSPPASPPESR